jgi:glycerophosphoryl diester phosphodiesterase
MSSDSGNTGQVIIVAHRGLWALRSAENSRSAFEGARAFGFPSECDVQESADGEPVVLHDETVNRTTTGNGLVSHLTEAQFRSLRLVHALGSSEAPPMLADVADLVTFVEIKPPNSRQLVRRVIEIMSGRRWLLQSFDPKNVEHALAEDSSVPVALLVDTLDGFEVALNNDWRVHADHKLFDDRSVGRLRDKGLSVGAWTVNYEEEFVHLLHYGIDVIISDQPSLLKIIAEKAGLRVGKW